MVERLRDHLGAVASDTSSEEIVGAEYPTDEVEGEPAEQYAEILSAGSGKIYIALQEEFSDAWVSTQGALSQAGIDVEEADKSRGVYSIKMPNAEGKKKGRCLLQTKILGRKK